MLSCSKNSSSQDKSTNAVVEKKHEDTEVVAIVNGEKIAWIHLKQLIPPDFQDLPKEKLDGILRRYLDRLISQTLIYQQAIKSGIQVDETEIKAIIEERKKMFPTQEDFLLDLKKKGLTLKKFRDLEKRNIIIHKMINKKIQEKASRLVISEEEIREFYENKKEKLFKLPDKINMAWIFVRVPNENIPGKSETAKKKIQEIIEKLKTGADFAALAREYSEDPSAKNNGELNEIVLDKLPPEIVRVAKQLEPGKFSDIIKINGGYAIIKLHSIVPVSYKPFEEVKDFIKEHLKNSNSRGSIIVWITKLRQESEIFVFL